MVAFMLDHFSIRSVQWFYLSKAEDGFRQPCLIWNGLHEPSCQSQWLSLLPIFPPVDHECFFLIWSKLWTHKLTHLFIAYQHLTMYFSLFTNQNWMSTSFFPKGLRLSLMQQLEVLGTMFLFNIDTVGWNIYVGSTKQILCTTTWTIILMLHNIIRAPLNLANRWKRMHWGKKSIC